MESIYKKKPLFVGRKVSLESATALRRFAHDLGLESALPASDMHLTVLFSKKEVDWHDLVPNRNKVRVSLSHLDMFGEDKNVLVLKVKDYSFLSQRNQYYLDNGGHSDWPDYKPHITLSWKANGHNIDMTRRFEEKITLEEEYFDDIHDTTDGYDPEETSLVQKPESVDEETWKYVSRENRGLFVS